MVTVFREMGAPCAQMKRAERAVVGAGKKLCGRLPSERGFCEVGELEEQVGLVATGRSRHSFLLSSNQILAN